ncbi:MAG: SPOR domain-containing protein [Melioribacteraceae bacterium]|nr:SPOR domain-containing protein [Melioribacteraceae bacterium]
MKIKFVITLLTILSSSLSAQEVNIVEYLKAIEDGQVETAISGLNNLKKTHPDDPSVLFLDAVLTEDGESALTKYQKIYEQHPNSNYADAALYRVFSYYYALGIYNRAENLLTKLKSEYSSSPYIRMANRNIPDVGETIEEPVEHIPETKPPASGSDDYKFTIQAGAFLNIDNAKNLLNEIQKDGYPAELGTKSVGGSLLNVVTFGHLESEEEADPLISYLKNKFNLNGRIITAE